MADTTTKATTKKPASKAATVAPKASAEKAPAAKKAAAPKAAKTAVAAKKPAAAKKKSAVSAEQRYNMIQDAAYYLAEREGFNGDSKGYWALAEKQIDEMIAAGQV